MMKYKNLFLAVATALAFASQAQAAVGLIKIDLDGSNVVNTGLITQDATNFGVTAPQHQFDGFSLGSLSLEGIADPSLSFSFGVVNTTNATETLSFTFVTNIVPISSATKVKASFQGTLTNNTDGVAATVTPVSGAIAKAYAVTPIPITAIPLGVDLGGPLTTGAVPSGTQVNYGPTPLYSPGPGAGTFTAGPTPATSFSYLAYTVNFTLTAGDSFSANGRVELLPVPEPESALMLVLGLAGVGFAMRRRIA